MKFEKFFALFATLIAATTIISTTANASIINSDISKVTHVKIRYVATDSDDLIKNSPYIIEAKVTDDQEKISYGGMSFIKTKLKVGNVLKGSKLTDKEIYLLQTECYEDPTVQVGSTTLLFLDKYSGSITDNAYVCEGLYQGQYKIEDNNIRPVTPSGESNDNLSKDFNNIGNINNFKNKISTICPTLAFNSYANRK